MVARKSRSSDPRDRRFFANYFRKLQDVQIIFGKLNDFAQMHVFRNGFRFRFVQLLARSVRR
jgi:hypothetical protein